MSRPRRQSRTKLRVIVSNGRLRRMPKKCLETGKENYLDRIQADFALTQILRNIRRSPKEPVRSYHCPCGWWHHTSLDEEQQSLIAARSA